MRLRREDLTDHLKRLSCAGQIKQAIFHGAFAAAAMTEDNLLVVSAPGLEGVEELPNPIGINDLDLLIKALAMVPGSEDDIGVDITVENVGKGIRLVIDEPGRGRVKLLTAEARTINTKVDQKIIDSLLAQVGSLAVPLTPTLVSGIRNTFAGLKASEIELSFGPDGGMIRIGDESSHMAEFPAEELQAPTAFALNFGEYLVRVLSTVDADATMYMNETPGKPAVVVDGSYTYILSPRSLGSSSKKKKGNTKRAVKDKAAAEAGA